MWLKERLGTLMRLASFKTPKGAGYGVVTDQGIVDLGKRIGNKYPDLKALIAGQGLPEAKKLAGEKADFKSPTPGRSSASA
jgi:hypothetical protein